MLATNRIVTKGKFNVPLTGSLEALPPNAGSKVNAVMNGVPYNAHTAEGSLMDFTGGAGVRFSSISSLHGLSLNLVGVTTTGVYTLSGVAPQRLLTAGRNGGTADSCCWGTNAPGDVGEVVVMSLSAQRVTGTITAKLKAQPGKPAASDLVITNGTFSIGLP